MTVDAVAFKKCALAESAESENEIDKPNVDEMSKRRIKLSTINAMQRHKVPKTDHRTDIRATYWLHRTILFSMFVVVIAVCYCIQSDLFLLFIFLFVLCALLPINPQ